MQLGKSGIIISKQGIGCMSMSEFYGRPMSEDDAIKLIKTAFASGITMFDTADVYGFGRNEIIVGKAITQLIAEGAKRDSICLATKYGVLRDENDLAKFGIENSYEYSIKSCNASLERLGPDIKNIDLYYVHRIADNGADLDDAMRAMAELLNAGKIKAVGLSEPSANHIYLANKSLLKHTNNKHTITAVQSEYSLISRQVEHEGVLNACKELGCTFIAYSPLSRALLTGQINNADCFDEDDYRKNLPRFSKENIGHNLTIIEKIREIAQDVGCSPAQLSLAWLMEKGVIPIPGTTKVKHLVENISALQIKLSNQQIRKLNMLGAVKGFRYDEPTMKVFGFDSELL